MSNMPRKSHQRKQRESTANAQEHWITCARIRALILVSLALATLNCGNVEAIGKMPPDPAAAALPVAESQDQPIPAGEDWPTRMHDNQRTGVTRESVAFPMSPLWTYTTERAPAPAWTESPAIHDYLHNWYDLKPRQHFDRCMDVAIEGSRVYFGSSTSGAVTCLDIQDGSERWSFFTDAPVRFSPHASDGRIYFGSDDGCVYCVDGETGKEIWRDRAVPRDDMVWGNQHMISVWPVRTSVLVDGEDVFWTAGMFPEEDMFVCKRKALDGTAVWTKPAAAPPQGYLLALDDRLFVPSGKSFPRVYSRETGECIGDVKNNVRDGGCWALIAPDTHEIWTGPTTANETQSFDPKNMARIASVRGANVLVVGSGFVYFTTDETLAKLDRDSQAITWEKPLPYPHSLIKTRNCLFAGGEGEIAAIDFEGNRLWTAPVDGIAYGLAYAHGKLFVSTDSGSIHCFQSAAPSRDTQTIVSRGAESQPLEPTG